MLYATWVQIPPVQPIEIIERTTKSISFGALPYYLLYGGIKMEKEILKVCNKHGETLHVIDSTKKRYRCKKCRVDAVDKRRRLLKQRAVDYKGGSCVKCGYNNCISALEFHHTDPTQKDFAISVSGHTRSWQIILNELDKCILVCCRCHREIHHELINKQPVVERNYYKEEKNCLVCNTQFTVSATNKEKQFCSQKCYKVSIRKIKERPSKEQLLDELKTTSYVQVGKKYGVSDNAIRKWVNSNK